MPSIEVDGHQWIRLIDHRNLLAQERARVGKILLERMPKEMEAEWTSDIDENRRLAHMAHCHNSALSDSRKVIEEVCFAGKKNAGLSDNEEKHEEKNTQREN